MIVVMNRLQVPVGKEEGIRKSFVHSTDSMNQVKGFIDFQLMHDHEKGEFVVYTKWQSQEDYDAWKTSEAFQQSHQGAENIPAQSQTEVLDVVTL